jgi:hypothetical protein
MFQVRGANGRSVFTVASAPIQLNGLHEESMLKFTTVDGGHVLIRIWNDRAAMGNEFQGRQSYVELAKHPSIHGAATGGAN